jgi:thiamine transport system substrate-binding protein
MKNQRNFSFLLVSIILLLTVFSPTPTTADNDIKLTIYTYDSLLADPGYDFIGNFSEFAGIDRDEIRLVLLSDSGSVLSRAVLEKNSPQADVLIGIDNAMVHTARANDVLTAYESPNLEFLREGLVEGLAPDHLLTPYDYGVISLWYDKNRFEGFEDFTISDLLDSDIQKQVILQDPRMSSPGLGFMLWTLAELGFDTESGDPTDEWKEFWIDINDDILLTNSWGDAINLFFTPEADRSIMVSYTSSPAYGACLFGDYSTESVISSVSDEMKGWFQIEGLGLVKDAPNQNMGKKFIDWFVSEELQSQIYQNQWMYPARDNIEIPACYSDSTLSPDEIEAYNPMITPNHIENHLNLWLDEWEFYWTYDGDDLPNTDQIISAHVSFIGLIILALIPKIYKKRKSW